MTEHPAASATLSLEEERDFDRFVTVRGGRLWRAAWLLTGDRHKAEDLVQTALARSYPRYVSLGDDESFEAYVRTAIYRTYVSWWRRRWNGEVPTETPVEPGGGLRQADGAERVDLVRALAELPKMQRAVLVLRFFEDRSVAETAALLGIAEGTVKTHTSRGCATLRGSNHVREHHV